MCDDKIIEYNLFIDSADRDIKVYPSQYYFTIDCLEQLNQTFFNVKYVKINSCILPKDIMDERFVTLTIKEFDSPTNITTRHRNNDVLSIIIPNNDNSLINKDIGWYYGKAITDYKMFERPISRLSKITIELTDSRGKHFKIKPCYEEHNYLSDVFISLTIGVLDQIY